MDAKDQYKTQQQIKEDVSSTHRAPYPQGHEINLPREKMNTTNDYDLLLEPKINN